jgi:uncharacterized protein (TIGR03083 family)
MTAIFDTMRRLDRREVDRLGAHLAQLDADGWREQSYCAEWRVYQVVSHLASGARGFAGSLAHWFDGAPPVGQEQMQGIWAHFDALKPEQMQEEFQAAIHDYFARLEALPTEAGLQEIDTFLGKMPMQDWYVTRLHEVVLHTWDVLVARDRAARFPDDALELLLPMQVRFRALRTPAPLAGKRVHISMPDGTWQQTLDFSGEKPVVQAGATAEAELRVEAPAEELCRLLSGRTYLPGSLPRLTWEGGTYQEVLALNIFGG